MNFLRLKNQFFPFFNHIFAFQGQKTVLEVSKVGFFCQVRMDMVFGNLHAKFGDHSSSSLVIIAAQTEISQKVAFWRVFLQFFEDFSYFPVSQSIKILQPSSYSPGVQIPTMYTFIKGIFEKLGLFEKIGKFFSFEFLKFSHYGQTKTGFLIIFFHNIAKDKKKSQKKNFLKNFVKKSFYGQKTKTALFEKTYLDFKRP